MRNRFLTAALALSLSICFSGYVLAQDPSAQIRTGNLYGTVTDDQAAPLPGATVTLTGVGAPQVQVTDAQGHFRFLALAPGTYALKAEMEGFSTVDSPNIDVKISRNTTVDVPMTMEDIITVTGESPLLDERRLSKDTVSAAELEKIPTARDPWEILKTTPGVLVDRINVGGYESGCGSSSRLTETDAEEGEGFAGPDTLLTSAMAAAGFLASDLDFDAFQEVPVPGEPVLRLRPRRGTNRWQASGSYTGSGGDLAGGGRSVEAPEGAVETNRVGSLRAGSAELGGSLVRDKLWVWGDAGFHEVQRIVLGGQEEEQTGRSGRFKLNVQMGDNVSTLLAASRGNAEGSGIGAAPTRAPETTWEEDVRETVRAVESTAIFSSNFYTTAGFGAVDGRLGDVPGSAGEAVRIGRDGVARGSWFDVREERRTRQARLSSSLYKGGSTYHEIGFGGGWRRQAEDSVLAPPGSLGISGSLLGLVDGVALAEFWRGGRADARVETSGLWLQDKMDADNWTLSAGLRADGQDLGIAGGPRPWTLAPRLQLLRTLGADRDTQVRASLARFASRLDARACRGISTPARRPCCARCSKTATATSFPIRTSPFSSCTARVSILSIRTSTPTPSVRTCGRRSPTRRASAFTTSCGRSSSSACRPPGGAPAVSWRSASSCATRRRAPCSRPRPATGCPRAGSPERCRTAHLTTCLSGTCGPASSGPAAPSSPTATGSGRTSGSPRPGTSAWPTAG